MTVSINSGASFLARKQVFHFDYEAEISQRLVDACHINDLKLALECISDPFVDVNFIGTVFLNAKKTELVLHEESAHEVWIEYEEFKTEVTALFLAAHSGNLTIVRELLCVGANVNQKLFRGYATTASLREGHLEILEILLKAGASQPACEEALLEASYLGRARAAELIMSSDMIRPHVAIHALVTACCRGFVDVVDTLIKCGVDANATNRTLLQSSKPSLHTNVDCNALAAAIVSRQVSVVRLLLSAGVRTDIVIRLGAWSWDMNTGEEFRVGAGLAEPYCITWCAVEYFEASGTILRMLLEYISPNIPHYGRTLVHHAILCNNVRALDVLISSGADIEFPTITSPKTDLRPIHLASRLGLSKLLQRLISSRCNINSKTESGETALMICTRYNHEECITILALTGADFGLVSVTGESVTSIAKSIRWVLGFQNVVLDIIRSGNAVKSSNPKIFSSLLFVTKLNDIEALKKLIEQKGIDLDEKDETGLSATTVSIECGHIDALRLLLHAGAEVKLSEVSKNHELFEKVLLECALENGNKNKNPGSLGFYALHHAAKRGDLAISRILTNKGYDVNVFDREEYTPLMLAARGNHGRLCEFLISCGARCDIKNVRNETALLLARKNGIKNEAQGVILDELARQLVLSGAKVKKHTKKGKGRPHCKVLRMVGGAGVLSWGKSSKRNLICKAAEVGPSEMFRWNRRKKFDVDEPGMFHIMTFKNKEVHFVCEGGVEMAGLWVRGIEVLTREAIFGKKDNGV